MKVSVGNPVEGDDFYDREKEQTRAWLKLESSHLLMLAPRRIGKTSLIMKLCATAAEHGFRAVNCSFAKCETEGDCIRLLFETVQSGADGWKLSETLRASLGRIKGINLGAISIDWAQDGSLDWRAAGEAIGKAFEEDGASWLVCVDELPVFILNLLKQGDEGKRRARAFLYWFRDLRQRHYQRVKWLTAGSIGLDTVASRLGLSDTINDLEPFPLAAFDEPTALSFLAKLASSYDMPLEEPLRRAIVRRVGWPVPYYLQLMFSKIREEWVESGQAPTEAMVERAFEAHLNPSSRVYFDYWRQRLEEELGQPEAGYAVLVLDGLSKAADGESKETLSHRLSTRISDTEEREKALNYLIDVLLADGYLVERDGRFAFRLEWLREYWRRRFAP